MGFKKLNNTLNKNIEEETSYINSISVLKYFLIFTPIYFVLFSIFMIILEGFSNYNWMHVLVKAIVFSVFWRIYHLVRKKWKEAWEK